MEEKNKERSWHLSKRNVRILKGKRREERRRRNKNEKLRSDRKIRGKSKRGSRHDNSTQKRNRRDNTRVGEGKSSVSKYELSVKSILTCAASAMCYTRKTSPTAVEQSGLNVHVAVGYTRSVLKTVL